MTGELAAVPGQVAGLVRVLKLRLAKGASLHHVELLREYLAQDNTLADFIAARRWLVDRGWVGAQRGSMGTACLPLSTDRLRELDLYEMCRARLQAWAAEQVQADRPDLREFEVRITALNGSSPDGTWSRPDLTMAVPCAQPLEEDFTPQQRTLHAYEIKGDWAVNLVGVFEALAQSRATHYASVVYCLDAQGIRDADPDIFEQADRFGVGVIACPPDPNGLSPAWEELRAPRFQAPGSAAVERFLQTIW